MDFLDSLDLEPFTHVKKTDRMRSWYLYEQYKTLEDHQLDAAQTLRNRSLQERLLQQELAERRARRNLYDQMSFTQSEHKMGRSQATCLSTTGDDFYENFCELHDFEADSLNHSHHGSETFIDDCKTIDESQEDTSCAGSVVSSVVDVDRETTNISAQRTIAENIKHHLQTVKNNMVSLEEYTRMADTMSEDSVDSLGWPKPNNVLRKNVGDNQLFCVWSRLVEFAYHIIQLNHGSNSLTIKFTIMCNKVLSIRIGWKNSTLLTKGDKTKNVSDRRYFTPEPKARAINMRSGAFFIIARGDILQYYVSPIKFADSEDNSTVCEKNKKKSYVSKKTRKASKYKINSSLHKKSFTKRCEGNCKSCGVGQQHRKCSIINRMDENGKGRPRNRKWPRLERTGVSRSTLWTEELDYRYRSRVNPMLRLVQCLDDVLIADMEDSAYDFY